MSQTQASPAPDTANREIIQTRTYDAPRELVYQAFTDPQHVPHWYGPNGFTITMHEMDVREGGKWRFIMHGPDGTDWDNLITYTKIVKPERLEYLHGASDEDPAHFNVIVTFEQKGNQTLLTMTSLFPTAEARAAVVSFGAIELGQQTLARLAEHLTKM
jgi:uncharacterized protein YndB with AHSA1/START domain